MAHTKTLAVVNNPRPDLESLGRRNANPGISALLSIAPLFLRTNPSRWKDPFCKQAGFLASRLYADLVIIIIIILKNLNRWSLFLRSPLFVLAAIVFCAVERLVTIVQKT